MILDIFDMASLDISFKIKEINTKYISYVLNGLGCDSLNSNVTTISSMCLDNYYLK